MKSKIKKILKIFISNKFIKKYRYALNLYLKDHSTFGIIDKIKCILFKVPKIKAFESHNFSKISKVIGNDVTFSKNFAYQINFNSFVVYKYNLNYNMTPDYSVILENSISDFKEFYKKNNNQLVFLDELEKYLENFIEKIESSTFRNKDKVIKNLKNIKDKKCTSFEEALQRILFFNQIFWQMGYTLCGLGRLDYILNNYYNNDLKNKIIDKKQTKEIIKDFYQILNYHFKNKSNCLYGDTGQIIILGGVDEKNKNFSNDLTYIFIEALKEFKKPDPKLFLRVNKNTDKKLLSLAIDCMATGIGSPLLSNDEVIIPMLQKYGYDKKDTWNYVTAACWEPSPCGNSIDFNNAAILNLLEPFNQIFNVENLDISLDEIEKLYFENLSNYIEDELNKLAYYALDDQPYFSLFISDCRKNGETISNSVPKYKNLGVTTLGISSVVNSILNIKSIVFDKKLYTLDELNQIRINNFEDKKILKIIKHNNKNGYGSTNKEAIDLTNKIIKFISKEFDKYTTLYGGKFKFGISAPSYLENGKLTKASFDGRKDGESFNVHISSNSNSYIEIMEFASNIEYEKNTINGNVIDFIISPNYIKNNLDKFTDYIDKYIKKGIYQLQINVIDSKTLIDAKHNPELYKNLVVRVWGFSAYFNDLPEEYKDLLIERAKLSEGLSGENG